MEPTSTTDRIPQASAPHLRSPAEMSDAVADTIREPGESRPNWRNLATMAISQITAALLALDYKPHLAVADLQVANRCLYDAIKALEAKP